MALCRRQWRPRLGLADDGREPRRSRAWGDGVTSQASFEARRAALRAYPLSTTYINWPYFEDRYQNHPTGGRNFVNLKYAFGQLRDMGVEPLVMINYEKSNRPWDPAGTTAGWLDRWEEWQHFYAQAFYLARNFDVHRFQMYNEPNLDDVGPTEWLERLRYSSDAVQAAAADVNALFGKSLDAQMQGPVYAGNVIPNYDTWVKPMMDSLHTPLFGPTDPNFNLIDTFVYHRYNISGDTIGANLSDTKNAVNADAGGTPIRFALSEFNVHTAATFDSIPETLDSPSKFSRLGSILVQLANNQPDELYVFKFSQGPGTNPGTIKKNGTHFVDNDNAPYNIGGVTAGGEVVRLFAKGFAGAHDLLNVPATSGTGASDLRLAAARNIDQNRYYLMSSNEDTADRPLTIDLGSWGIEAGTRAVVEQVSADRHGEVSQLLTIPANGVLNLTQPAQSVLMISIFKTAPTYVRTLGATDDAMVKAGGNANKNYGSSSNLYAKNEPVNPSTETSPLSSSIRARSSRPKCNRPCCRFTAKTPAPPRRSLPTSMAFPATTGASRRSTGTTHRI